MEKAIPGYEGKYVVTDTGEIISTRKDVRKVKKLSQNTSGYLITNLSSNGVLKTVTVHRLVAEAFIPNPDNLPIVDHIDEDKTNNAVTNLRWCTTAQNTKYYNTKDGRRHHIALAKERKRKLRAYEQELQAVKRELLEQAKKLEAKQAALVKAELALKQKEAELQKAQNALAKYVHIEMSKKVQQYEGYQDTKGQTFGTVDEMVDVVGKKIIVAGTEFRSVHAATAYIVAEELKLGYVRKYETVRKELRQYMQGIRSAFTMYKRWTIGS